YDGSYGTYGPAFDATAELSAVLIDAGDIRVFGSFVVFQMFADGKITEAQILTHPSLGSTPPDIQDAGWQPVNSNYVVIENDQQGTVINPVTPVTARQIQIRGVNDGRYGFGQWMELRALKGFGPP